jgi:DNA mismatch repair protein MutS2
MSYLSEGGRNFENIVRRAEDSRIEAQNKLEEVTELENEWKQKLKEVNAKIDSLNKERDKLNANARAESRRIINERTAQAEEMLDEMEKLFAKETLTQGDLIKARTLKNSLKNSAYGEEEREVTITDFKDATAENLKEGCEVFVKSLDSRGTIVSFNGKKNEAEVQCGSIKYRCKITDLQIINEGSGKQAKPQAKVKVVRRSTPTAPVLELNVIGMNVEEALYEVDNFIDKAVMDNLEEVKVIHGVGTGKLRNAIAQRLKSHRHVKSFRLGKYGEGETGVTIITLK